MSSTVDQAATRPFVLGRSPRRVRHSDRDDIEDPCALTTEGGSPTGACRAVRSTEIHQSSKHCFSPIGNTLRRLVSETASRTLAYMAAP